MFRKIIKSCQKFLKEISPEEWTLLLTSVGLVFLGVVIYVLWQFRLAEPPEFETEPEQEETINENSKSKETESESAIVLENDLHGYKITNIAEKVKKIDKVYLFELLQKTNFAVEYKGITHTVFENPQNLSLENWIENKIKESGLENQTFEEKKIFLNIILEREKDTTLGKGIEIIRMNGYNAGDLFIPWQNYILSFSYKTKNPDDIPALEKARNDLIKNITPK